MKKKILILSSRIPDKNGKADQITVYKFAEYLKTNAYTFKIISTYFPWQKLNDIYFKNELVLIKLSYFHLIKTIFKNFLFSKYPISVSIFDEKKIKDKVHMVTSKENITDIYCHLIRTSTWITSKNRNINYILGAQLVWSLNCQKIYKFSKSIIRKIVYYFEYKKSLSFEKNIFNFFDRVNFVSTTDVDFLNLKSNNFFFIPHGINILKNNNNYTKKKYDYMFLANFAPETNLQGLKQLLFEIWPKILEHNSKATLCVCGRNIPKNILNYRSQGLTILGEVKSSEKIIRTSKVFLNSVFAGAGMQNKVLNALEAGVTCVTPKDLIQGMKIPKDLIYTSENNVESFVLKSIEALKKPLNSKKMQNYIKKNWSWDNLHEKFLYELFYKSTNRVKKS